MNVDYHVPDLLQRWDLWFVELFASQSINFGIFLFSFGTAIFIYLLRHINSFAILLKVKIVGFILFILGSVFTGPVDVWRNATDLLLLEAHLLSFADVLVVVDSCLVHMFWVEVVLVMKDLFGVIMFLLDAWNLMVLFLPVHVALGSFVDVLQRNVMNTVFAMLLRVFNAVFFDNVRRYVRSIVDNVASCLSDHQQENQ